jgi:hypothetical protein
MTKKTALVNATKKPASPEAWIAEAEKPKAAATTEKPARLVVEIPPSMHRRLKMECAKNGLTIKGVMESLIDQYLNGDVGVS